MENIATSITRRRKPRQGPNVRIARTCKNITQEDLAFRMNMSQSKISALEIQDEIGDETLEKLAKVLDVPVDFLKNFAPEETIKSYNVCDNEIYMTHGENSKGDIMGQKIVEKEEIIYNPLEKVTELYERLIQEKDKQLERFELQIGAIQKQLEELKANFTK